MLYSVRNIALSVCFTFCPPQILLALQSQQPCVKVEFRRAERTPGKGLKEVTVRSTNEKVYLHKEIVITNRDFLEARVVPPTDSTSYEVEVTFNKQGAKTMTRATTGMIGKPLAILIDGQVISAPTINSQISDKARIFGVIGEAEAQKIADAINGCGNQIRGRAQAETARTKVTLGPIKIEIREAESAPAKGLRQARVMNTEERIYLYPRPVITNSDIIEASARKNLYGDNYGVEVILSSQGAQKMIRLSRARIGKQLAILIDGRVISVPIVISEISDKVAIVGSFTKEEAERIAQKLTRQ
jgi:preprotein translocase subunit SecD